MIDVLTAPAQTQARFRRFVERNPACLLRSSFGSLDEASRMTGYPLQSWPTFVDPGDLLQLQRAVVGVTGLIKQIPARVFGLDPGRMADFYGIERREADEVVAVLCGVDCLSGNLMRVDLLQSADGWKCLEANSTANLGGWRPALVAGSYLGNPWIRGFLQEEGLEVSCRRPLQAVFAHIVRTARRRVRDVAGECNVAVVTSRPAPAYEWGLVNGEYRATLRQEDAALGGEAFSCGYLDLALDGTRLFHRGKRVHAVLEQYNGYVPREVLTSWFAGDTVVFNGPASRMLSDKRNLAILSQELDGARFDEAERSLIAAHVPWTRIVRPGPASLGGEAVDLAELLAGRREGFVLKPAVGARGEGVHVGKFTTPVRWAEALAEALAAGDWIAQEYVEPLSFDYQIGAEGCAPHEVIWGIFVLGESLGGGFLRMMPRGAGDGVINSARGATEGPIFEVRERRRPAG